MAKAYWIGQISVQDAAGYEAYRQANAAAFDKYGAKFLVRGGAQTVAEGQANPRSVVIEFADLQTALACYHSPEYQAAKALRDPVSHGNLVIVEGYEEAADVC
ncbi:MAG: hypothetical protein CSA68_06330 [Rhodobacterales bacterium]|nr:MAG: hypothetical protein CSA68_06330 [Rhodobacterales bacterium]